MELGTKTLKDRVDHNQLVVLLAQAGKLSPGYLQAHTQNLQATAERTDGGQPRFPHAYWEYEGLFIDHHMRRVEEYLDWLQHYTDSNNSWKAFAQTTLAEHPQYVFVPENEPLPLVAPLLAVEDTPHPGKSPPPPAQPWHGAWQPQTPAPPPPAPPEPAPEAPQPAVPAPGEPGVGQVQLPNYADVAHTLVHTGLIDGGQLTQPGTPQGPEAERLDAAPLSTQPVVVPRARRQHLWRTTAACPLSRAGGGAAYYQRLRRRAAAGASSWRGRVSGVDDVAGH